MRFLSPLTEWLDRNWVWVVVALAVLGLALRVELAVFSPTPDGYWYDPYYQGVSLTYEQRRLPQSTDCWQCYHPPLFYLLGWPLYAVGMWAGGGNPDVARRWLSALPFACGCWCAVASVRVLRQLKFTGGPLVLGAALVLAFPCLFISTYGTEADVLLSALLVSFLYRLLRYDADPAPRLRQAVGLGVLAGLAAATKYSGLIAVAASTPLFFAHFFRRTPRWRAARHFAVALAVAAAVGGWKYVDNAQRYGTPLYANGTANEGFAVAGKRWHWEKYDFFSVRVPEMLELTRPDAPPGQLTNVPAYRSVWTALHAQGWGDMSFFSEPTRHGIGAPLYPPRGVPPWLAGAVLILGLAANAVALVGFVVTCRRREYLPVTAFVAVSVPAYFFWVLSQESWALKTKYLLFLLPAYVAYILAGLGWVRRVAPRAVSVALTAVLVALVVLAHAYLHCFARGAG